MNRPPRPEPPLLERLRKLEPKGSDYHSLGCEAADEIERLRAELAEARAELRANEAHHRAHHTEELRLVKALSECTQRAEAAEHWNQRVSVCAEHIADIVDGACVVCLWNSACKDVERLAAERDARNKTDPTTRLHNLVDALEEHRAESPYNAEALELADASYKAKCKEMAELRQYAVGLAGEAVAQYVDMVNALHPGFSRPALDDLWHAMQTKYGSARRQYDMAVKRAQESGNLTESSQDGVDATARKDFEREVYARCDREDASAAEEWSRDLGAHGSDPLDIPMRGEQFK